MGRRKVAPAFAPRAECVGGCGPREEGVGVCVVCRRVRQCAAVREGAGQRAGRRASFEGPCSVRVARARRLGKAGGCTECGLVIVCGIDPRCKGAPVVVPDVEGGIGPQRGGGGGRAVRDRRLRAADREDADQRVGRRVRQGAAERKRRRSRRAPRRVCVRHHAAARDGAGCGCERGAPAFAPVAVCVCSFVLRKGAGGQPVAGRGLGPQEVGIGVRVDCGWAASAAEREGAGRRAGRRARLRAAGEKAASCAGPGVSRKP